MLGGRGKPYIPLSPKKLRAKKPEPDWPKLEIPMVPPSGNVWNNMHWAEQGRLKGVAYTLIGVALAQSKGLPPVISTPCLIKVDVYKVRGRKGDSHNLIPTVDKLFIDALTEPRGRKTRGFALFPDDSPEYLTISDPVVHLKAEADKTVLTFVSMKARKK